MSIEQRIIDAIADFRGLIREGRTAEDALSEASNLNSLSVDVLRSRLSKNMPIDTLVEGIRAEALRDTTYEKIRDALSNYPSLSRKEWMKTPEKRRQDKIKFVERALGRALSSVDLAQFDKADLRLREERSIAFSRMVTAQLGQVRPADAQD